MRLPNMMRLLHKNLLTRSSHDGAGLKHQGMHIAQQYQRNRIKPKNRNTSTSRLYLCENKRDVQQYEWNFYCVFHCVQKYYNVKVFCVLNSIKCINVNEVCLKKKFMVLTYRSWEKVTYCVLIAALQHFLQHEVGTFSFQVQFCFVIDKLHFFIQCFIHFLCSTVKN